MKNIKSIFLVIILSFLISGISTAQEKTGDKKESVKVNSEVKGKPVNTICPVSTEAIDEEITYEYKGKTYAVCCNSCLKKFKADPEKYISRLSEDGKSIKKKNNTK